MKNQIKQSGLTLIEVLVALAIVAIAMTAVIKVAAQNLRHTGYLQEKTIAYWVANNVLAEAQLGLMHLPKAPEKFARSVEVLDQDWYWQASEKPTANKRIKQMTVDVFTDKAASETQDPLFTLMGYRYDAKAK